MVALKRILMGAAVALFVGHVAFAQPDENGTNSGTGTESTYPKSGTITGAKGKSATVTIDNHEEDLVLTTFNQESTGGAIRAENLPLNLIRLPLHDQIWAESFKGNPIDTVGETMKITSITIPDLGDSLAARVAKLELLGSDGKLLASTGSGERSDTAELRLKSEKGTYVMAHTTTYTFTTQPDLPCHNTGHTQSYFLQFVPVNGVTAINVPVFINPQTTRTDADATHLRVTDSTTTTPYIEITGTTSFDVVEVGFTEEDTYSLHDVVTMAQELHGKDHTDTGDVTHEVDSYAHLIIARAWAKDVVLEMDHTIAKAELVVASSMASNAPTLRFLPSASFTGALSVRDASIKADGTASTAQGMVRFEYVDANGTAQLVIPTSVFSPFSFTQKCDVELASYPQKLADATIDSETEDDAAKSHWFWRNPFKVPAGRRLRLVTCTNEQLARLPDVAFTDASSILDLDFDSSSHETHEMAEAVGKVIDGSSGTLVINSATFSHEGTDVTMGKEVGDIYGMPTEQTIHAYNNLDIKGSFVIANGMGTMADIVQHAGTTTIGDSTDDIFRFGRGSTTDGSALGAARAVYTLKEGTLNVPGTLLFSNRVQVGRLSVGDGEGNANTAVATIGTLKSYPEKVNSNPGLGQSLASTPTGVATVEVLSDGHLKLANNLNFTPPEKSFFYLKGGTLESTTQEATFTFGQDTSLGGGLRLDGNTTSTIIGKEGTSTTTNGTTVYTPGLTVDAVTGDGDLELDGAVRIGELRDFRGRIDRVYHAPPEGTTETDPYPNYWVQIGALSGARSVVTFGDLGENGTTGVERILTMAQESVYRGSLGFAADVYKVVHVEAVEIVGFTHALRIANGQEMIIRLDQFSDTIIGWPTTIDTNNPPILTLVEAGAYGGRLTMPHIPEGVKVNFEYYDAQGNRQLHTDGTWKITTEESGATDILSWEEPHVDGKGAWINVEFEAPNANSVLKGNSLNTGWLTLGATNGVLKGIVTSSSSYGRLLDENTIEEDVDFFTDTYNPVGKGVKLYVRPYLDTNNGSSNWWLEYPEVWSSAIRMTPPRAPRKVILAIGTLMYSNNTKQILVLATGATQNELVLWHIKKNDGTDEVNNTTGAQGKDDIPDNMVAVAKATIADRPDIMHVVSTTCDGKQLVVYLDGKELVKYALPENFPGFGTGLQVGQLLDDGSNAAAIRALLGGVGEYYQTDEDGEYVLDSNGNKITLYDDRDGGVVDYIRFYKGELTPEAMAALSEESPAIDRATRYLRTLTATNENWVDDSKNPWTREIWTSPTTANGLTTAQWVLDKDTSGNTLTFAEPTEGAEVRLTCTGAHTLAVNTVKTGEFLTANRSYSLLTVTLSASATGNCSLALVPIGGEITSQTLAENSPWMNNTIGSGDDKTYQYGALYFFGGAGDMVHPEAAMVPYATREHTFWLRNHDVGSTNGEPTSSDPTYGDPQVQDWPTSGWRRTYTRTRTAEQTSTETQEISGISDYSIRFAATAGVCHFQEQTPIVVNPNITKGNPVAATRTTKKEWTQKQSITKTFFFGSGSEPTDTDWANETWTDVEGSVVETPGAWIASAGNTANPNWLQMRADYSLVRGATDKESAVHVLTGPVEGAGQVIGNSEVAALQNASQTSDYVWVPKFEGGKWHISDVTETYYGVVKTTDAEGVTTTVSNNPKGTVRGLIAKVMQVPSRLYLDLTTQDLVQTNGKALFSKQSWYRYGYINTPATKTESGEAPVAIDPTSDDFATAIAFQIKAKDGVELVMDTTKGGVSTLRIDPPAGMTATNIPTLTLKNDTTAPKTMTLTGQLITFVRLKDLEGALTIKPGTLIHGHTTGTYAFKNHTQSHLIKDSTVANLEVHGELNNFSGSVELHDTNLILADGAKFHQSNPDAHLWMKSLTLGNGATFNFEARGADVENNGVIFTDRVTLTGTSATLFGGGELGSDETAANIELASHFTAAGFTALQAGTTLTVHSAPLDGTTTPEQIAAKPNRWICYTADFQTATTTDTNGNTVPLGGFGLTKTGAGTMAFRDLTPPTLSGMVRVKEGILRVGGKAQSSDALLHDGHLNDAIGHHGLYVAAGATLASNRLTPTDYVIACLEKGQVLAGTGTIDGNVRLCSGASVDGTGASVNETGGIGMWVRRFVLDGSATSDVTVTLPSTVAHGDTLFYLMDDSVRTETRRRFKAMNGTARWDVVGAHKAEDDKTSTWAARYYVERPYLPIPEGFAEGDTANQWETKDANGKGFDVEKTFITYYQSYGVANILKTHGRTKGGTHTLNATEIGDAFQLFSNVWTFGELKETNLVDMRHLLMAYELGISRETIRPIATTVKNEAGEESTTMQSYVVVEVTLENALATAFGSQATTQSYNALEGESTTADFQLGADVKIVDKDGNAFVTHELTGFDATTLVPPTVATRTAGKRYYAIPYTDANFPLGTTYLKVLVVPKSTSSNGTQGGSSGGTT